LRTWRKPLVVMTPKSLLRHPKAVSSLDDCARGSFQRVIADTLTKPGETRRVILCTGKIYYELTEYREQAKRGDVAIIRLEQLYPLRRDLLERAMAPYASGTPVFWVQEEPENMGGSIFMRIQFGERLFDRFPFGWIARTASASPATGSHRRHKQEQAELVARAFGESQ
jgi:2-oxoglutarate dehydrogenase E1 component